MENEQLAYRQMYPQTSDGTFVVGNAIKLSEWPQQPNTPYVATRGEHTEQVLAELTSAGTLRSKL